MWMSLARKRMQARRSIAIARPSLPQIPLAETCCGGGGEGGSKSTTIGVLALTLGLICFTQHSFAEQKSQVFRIGFLTGQPLAFNAGHSEPFRTRLRELGYIEGANVVIEWRSHAGNRGRQRALATELVRLRVDVIVAVGSADIRAVKEATETIPVVMVVGVDPVGNGFVASLARPGGNVTGLATLRPEFNGKCLELLKETFPSHARVAVFMTSTTPAYAPIREELERRGAAIGVTLQYYDVLGPGDIETAFRAAVAGRADAVLFLVSGKISVSRQRRIAALALESRLPVIYQRETQVKAGGLMSYGVNFPDLYRRAATFVDKILKGAKPADLPVEQPTTFKLAVNLKTAKALGVTIPPSILLRADRVIE